MLREHSVKDLAPITEGDDLVPGTQVVIRVGQVGGKSIGIIISVVNDCVRVLWAKDQHIRDFFPISKKMSSRSFAKLLVSIQPMSVPSGLIFYEEFQRAKSDIQEQDDE